MSVGSRMTGIEFHGDALLAEVNINWVQIVQVVQIVQLAGRANEALTLLKRLDRFERLELFEPVYRVRDWSRFCKASPSRLRLNTVTMIARPG